MQFIDTTAGLWASGELADNAVTSFSSAINTHGGNGAILLTLYSTMCHWGAIIVPPGYTAQEFGAAGGNPYGVSHPSMSGPPAEAALAAARTRARRAWWGAAGPSRRSESRPDGNHPDANFPDNSWTDVTWRSWLDT